MGLPNPSRETNFSGANADREMFYFPCSAHHEQDWQPYPVDPYSCCMRDHMSIFIILAQSEKVARTWFLVGKGLSPLIYRINTVRMSKTKIKHNKRRKAPTNTKMIL